MNHADFMALTRRASLLTLGTVGLAAVYASPFPTGARKKQGKTKRQNRDVNKLCKRQVGQCVASGTPSCEGDPDCLARVERCCPLLAKCNFDGFFVCAEPETGMRGLVAGRLTL